MTIIYAIIAGIIQGVTEFFPISSSGHLVLLQSFLGFKEPQIAFDIFLHIGTMVSILLFFWRDIINLFGKDKILLFLLIVASIPTFAIGLCCEEIVDSLFGMPTVTGCMLIITGLWLCLASLHTVNFAAKKKLGLFNSFVVGVAQGIAIIPGISRSGSTIATGILFGVDKELVFKFAFLLAIPATLGAAVVKAGKIGFKMVSGEALYFIVGGITAMVVGNFAIKTLFKIVKNNQLYFFGIYCIFAGLIIIVII